jgi:hypothetical protein
MRIIPVMIMPVIIVTVFMALVVIIMRGMVFMFVMIIFVFVMIRMVIVMLIMVIMSIVIRVIIMMLIMIVVMLVMTVVIRMIIVMPVMTLMMVVVPFVILVVIGKNRSLAERQHQRVRRFEKFQFHRISGQVFQRLFQPGSQRLTDPDNEVGLAQPAGIRRAHRIAVGRRSRAQDHVRFANSLHHPCDQRVNRGDIGHHPGRIRQQW